MKVYKILVTEDVRKLERLVNASLKHDWECQGGVAVTSSQVYAYCQAMIKIKEKNK